MKHFWKIFGIAVLGMLVVSGIAGIVRQSAALAFLIAKSTFTCALAVSGILGLLVPVQLYLEDRKRKEDKTCC